MSQVLTNPELDDLSLRYGGKLLLRDEILLEESEFQQLLQMNYFDSTPSIINKTNMYECQRCGNAKESLIALLPCYICKKDQLYCRKCIQMGRVIACEPLYTWTGKFPEWPINNDPCTWEGELTNAQKLAADRIVQAIYLQEREILVWAVCGAGKTEMLFPGITSALQQGKRICIATPRSDVVRELLPRFQEAFSETTIAGLYGGSEDKSGTAQLIISTTHQLLRYKAAFDLIIIDEIDAFPYHADPSLPFATNRALKKGKTMVYLTATPREKEQAAIKRNTLPHIFVPIRFHGHPLPIPSFKMCFSLKKDLAAYSLPTAFIKWLANRVHKERQILIFVPTIRLAEEIQHTFVNHLLTEKIISSKEELLAVHAEDADRKEKVELFRKKEVFILLTTTILERGVTFPSIDVAVIDAGHIVFDEAALVQIAGRAGRSPKDPDGEVIFYHDGKTEAMVDAVRSIKLMNKRGGFR